MSEYSISTIFSSLSTSSDTSLNGSLMDYNLIRRGTYAKLMEAYYAEDDSVSKTDTSTEKTGLKLANTTASGLEASTKALLTNGSTSVFNKKITAAEDGSETTSYDMDAIYDKVSNFIENYNDLLDAGADSDNEAILRAVASMTGSTEANKNILSDIGISVGSDNKLSIDKSEFKNEENISTIKTLFNGYGSYAYNIQTRAQTVQYAALTALNKIGTYSSDGSYNVSTAIGSIYDGIV